MTHSLGRKERSLHKVLSESLVVLFAFGAVLFFSCGAGAEIVERIVAVVNDEVITLTEVREISIPYMQKMKEKFSMKYGEEEILETERRIVDQLVDELLVNQEAERLKIEVTDKEVELGIKNVMEGARLNRDQFEQALAEDGLTMEEYRKQLKKQIRKMRLIDQEVKSKVQVTGNEIDNYYEAHKSEFNAPPEIRLQQILLIVPPKASNDEIEQIRKKAEQVLQEIKEGADFGDMAKRYSQDVTAAAGGDIGVFVQGDLFPALDEIVFTLPVGGISPVIQGPKGFHIVKVLGKKERQNMTEEERREEISNIIYNQKVESAFKQWIKELRNKSYVAINL